MGTSLFGIFGLVGRYASHNLASKRAGSFWVWISALQTYFSRTTRKTRLRAGGGAWLDPQQHSPSSLLGLLSGLVHTRFSPYFPGQREACSHSFLAAYDTHSLPGLGNPHSTPIFLPSTYLFPTTLSARGHNNVNVPYDLTRSGPHSAIAVSCLLYAAVVSPQL